MAYIIVPSRRVLTRQEAGLRSADGLMMIGAFSARDGYFNLANGRPLTRGSAAVLRTAAPGVVAQQTAVNQGAWCPVALPSINAKYIAIWHGVFIGAITGGSPTLVGIANSTTSQQVGPINIIRETNDTITVAAKLGGTAASRTFSVSSSGWYGKTVTLVAFYEISTLTVQLLVYVNGQLTRYSSALSFGGDTAPTVLGTEQFVVGTDVIENPTRSPGVQTALAACLCGAIPTNRLAEIAENPWQIFRPRTRRIFVFQGASGGSTLNADATGQAQASGTAQLAAQIALAGIGVAVAGGQANAAVAVPLAAAGIAVAGGQADARATVAITAAGLAQAAASAGLSASVLLAGAGAAQAAGNGHLTALLEMLAAGAAEASGSAQLSGGAQGDMSASGQASAGGSGVLTVTVSLSAAGLAQASGTASGSAGSPGDVSAAGGAVSDGSATWSAVLQLTAPGFVQAMGAGALSVDVSLVAAGAGQASGQARASLAGASAAYCISSSARRVTEIISVVRLVTTINHEVRCVCD